MSAATSGIGTKQTLRPLLSDRRLGSDAASGLNVINLQKYEHTRSQLINCPRKNVDVP
jgi:hypothetical protein